MDELLDSWGPKGPVSKRIKKRNGRSKLAITKTIGHNNKV